MKSGNEDNPPRTITPAELQEIVQVFADSDLRELRLTVGDVDLLVSRNEQVHVADTTARTPPPPLGGASAAAAATGVTAADVAPPSVTQFPSTAQMTRPGKSDRDGLLEIRSPAVGMFYGRPAPDKPPFVEPGTTVSLGDPVGTIEVMKMFTTVTAETAGTVVEVCVQDATLVEYNQVLMYLALA